MATTSKPVAAPLAPAQIEPPYPSPILAWYVVGVLMVVYIFSFVDRQILSLMVEPMKKDLGINDEQMGILTGFTFALFYTVCGFPLGRLADTHPRRRIIAIGLVAWSLFTAACGAARNYGQLLLLRMGVGVGEATLSPSAYSMITDYFPPQRRSTAISAYSMGIYIGSGIAYVLGGTIIGWASQRDNFILPIVGETRPWQLVFFIVGLPGLLMALVVLTVREPLRRGRQIGVADANSRPTLRDVLRFFSSNRRTFFCHTVGFALLSLASNADGFWVPTIFNRVHQWQPAKTGLMFGSVVALACTVGVLSAGWIVDLWIKRGTRDAAMRLGIIATLLGFPSGIWFCLESNSVLAAWLLVPGSIFAAMPFGIAPAAIQQVTPNVMRGQASALYLFVVNLIGMGLGPPAVGFVTERILQDPHKVNYSLLIVSTTARVLAITVLAAGLTAFRRSDAQIEHR